MKSKAKFKSKSKVAVTPQPKAKVTVKATSRPTRSFLPADGAIAKSLHFKGHGAPYVGEIEPEWPPIEVQEQWARDQFEKHYSLALNWYANSAQEDKVGHELALKALNLSGHFPELTKVIANSTRRLSHTAAWTIRMAHHGMLLPFHERKFIVREIRACIEAQKEIVALEDRVIKPGIQDYINAKLRRAKGEIDGLFDTFVELSYKKVDRVDKAVLDILNSPEISVPSNRTKDLIEYAQQYLNEYKAALAGRDPYVVESYAHLGKRELKAAISWWEQAITDINTFGQIKQSVRKTRTRKAKPVSKIVGKLKFLKSFNDLGLVSIDPAQILKSSELWVYNTKLRKIGRYVALGNSSFDIKGTRLLNLDTVKSVQKTLRKPAEQLRQFNTYGKPGAIKWFTQIRATATPLRAAINGESILLRSVK